MRPGPSPAQLDEISALAVAEAVRPFSVHGDWTGPATQGTRCPAQGVGGRDGSWHALRGLGEQLRFLIKIRCGERYFCQRLRVLRLGDLRRDGINTTPAGSGGSPANVQSSSAQAAR
jgi:hypothetical protein